MVTYYERDDAEAPGPLLPALAQAIRVTTDEVLGVKSRERESLTETARLLKRLRKIEQLPPVGSTRRPQWSTLWWQHAEANARSPPCLSYWKSSTNETRPFSRTRTRPPPPTPTAWAAGISVIR